MHTGGPDDGDLLGDPVTDIYAAPVLEPGKIVDLSGSSSSLPARPSSSTAASSVASGSSASSAGIKIDGKWMANSVNFSFGTGSGGGPDDRGPRSLEGGGGETGFSLGGLTPTAVMQHLASRPLSELVTHHGRQVVQLPANLVQAYTAVARRYLRPWNEFARFNPARMFEALRDATRRGELQIHLQRNVLANVRSFCPNYAFIFMATMLFFVCTSPWLLCMLGAVGGGWSHALKSEDFRSRPWTLQVGGLQLPLGANMKMAILSLPTLFVLHFFMGPVLWSAALYSGGASLCHAALRDRDDDQDNPDTGGGENSLPTLQELP